MFGALKQGCPLFVLDKKDKPCLKVGRVETTTHPTGYNIMSYGQGSVGQTFDIVVKYDDGTTDEFKQLQTQNSMAYYGNVVLTETRELMLQEIDAMERESKKVVASLPYHEAVLKSIGEMKIVLSPEYAKNVETENRLTTLEQGQKTIIEMLSHINASTISKSNK